MLAGRRARFGAAGFQRRLGRSLADVIISAGSPIQLRDHNEA
jgi:hypothetical protein